MTMTLIQHQELASAQASITFSSIPQTYTDLFIVACLRSSRASGNDDGTILSFNSSTSNRSGRALFGVGSGSPFSFSESTMRAGSIPISLSTANTFGNMGIYIPNYTGSTAKSVSVDGVMENNATYAAAGIIAGLWNDTAAVTSVSISSEVATLVQYSSATLYGILKGTSNGVTVS